MNDELPPESSMLSDLRADFVRLRRARGITQRRIAQLVGYSGNSNISEFESGKTIPGSAHLQKIMALVEKWRQEELIDALALAAKTLPAAREDGPKNPSTPSTTSTPIDTPALVEAIATAYETGRPDLAAKLRAAVAELDALDKKRSAVLEQQTEILREIDSAGEKRE